MYKLASSLPSQKNLTQVDAESQFARAIGEVIVARGCSRVIETGTHLGLGTTVAVAGGLARTARSCRFFSIEVNPDYHRQSEENTRRLPVAVTLLNGLSIPRSRLLSKEEIHRQYVAQETEEEVYVDHDPTHRADTYHGETGFDAVPDDLLRYCFNQLGGKPDFILLDSAGHLGFIEFQYTLELLKSPCVLALDDTCHVKHHASVKYIKAHPERFKILTEGDEKFGFCIVEVLA